MVHLSQFCLIESVASTSLICFTVIWVRGYYIDLYRLDQTVAHRVLSIFRAFTFVFLRVCKLQAIWSVNVRVISSSVLILIVCFRFNVYFRSWPFLFLCVYNIILLLISCSSIFNVKILIICVCINDPLSEQVFPNFQCYILYFAFYIFIFACVFFYLILVLLNP